MNQREKILSGIVGLLVVVVGGYYFFSQYLTALQFRDTQIDAVAKQIRNEEFVEARAHMALEKFAKYQKHSLPESIRTSQAFYQQRLREAVEDAGFSNVSIKPTNGREGGKHYQHVFSVSGRATLEELVTLTYQFYTFNVLHKFTKLTIVPIRDSEQLDITFNVEVLSVEGNSEVPTPDSVQLDQLTYGTLEDYQEVIVNRNVLGQANKPPLFTSKTSVEAEQGKQFSHRLSAKDPDRTDRVKFYLVEDAPEGIELSESGSLSWKPSELGEFKINVEARDDRSPYKSSKQELVVKVVEPKPEEEPKAKKPEFDEAEHTYLTATVSVGSNHEAWLNNRPKNKRLTLTAGESFTVGSMKGTIIEVSDREVILEIEGSRRLLKIGKPLKNAIEIDSEDAL